MKKYFFSDLKKFLISNNIKIITKFKDNDYFTGINSLDLSNSSELTFLHNTKYLDLISSTKAKGCFINEKYIKNLTPSCIPIFVDNPYLAFALTTNFLYPKKKSNNTIEKNSSINKNSILGKNIQIDNNVVIYKDTKISNNCIISSNSTIGPNVFIDEGTHVMSNCNISNAIIGKNSFIQSGAVIGGKGFGFTPESKIEIRHIGKVIIGDNVDIGSNTTIDRASLSSTTIGDNVRIDNLVQIAHGVSIGKNTIIAAQCGIAGSTKIGENCLLGGQVGISGHLEIGDNVRIAAKSGVTKNIKSDSIIAGFPAIDIKKWKKLMINQLKKINDS